jgi:PAS domain S-box-containing protein
MNFGNVGLAGLAHPQRPDVKERVQDPARETKRLERCINDLVSVFALPAIWRGSEPSQIVQTLLDVLLRMLALEFAYGQLNDPFEAGPVEVLRVAENSKISLPPQQLPGVLRDWLATNVQGSFPQIRNRSGIEEISIFPVPLGIHGEIGVIVLGSNRVGFPEKTESLLLSVAANQASIGLQEAKLLSEQKRIAVELELRVAERTQDLDRTNSELRKEIAERRRAEEALRGSEQSLRLILDGIAGLVAIMGATGEVEAVNRQVLDYFGRSLEEIKGWSTSDAVHPNDLFGVILAWKHSVETVSAYDVDHRLRGADNVYRWFHARGVPLLDAEGRILRWYVLLTDIDDRRRAEEALARNEAFLAEGQHLSRTGSFSWYVKSGEITCSEQLYRIFEFEQGTAVTLERIGSRIHPEDLHMLEGMIDRAREGVSDFEYEHRLLMPDNSVKHLHLIAHGRRDSAGRLECIGAVQDVTQRRLSEDALGKARSELAKVASITSLGVLTASIAHEVNQPLSGIATNASTCLRMLSADPPNIAGACETARRAIRDVNRASDVITRLRTLYSKKEPTLESMDLNEVAREVTALSSTEIQRNGVTLRQEFADDLPPALGDRIQLQQVILNLLRNAADAMSAIDDRPRELLVRTERDDGNRVRLSVKDSGVGLTPQAADKIFEAFYTTKTDGMGIGLSISRSIIEAHQGRLWATRNDGPGSTFSFSIPCRLEDSVNAETRVNQPDPSTDAA